MAPLSDLFHRGPSYNFHFILQASFQIGPMSLFFMVLIYFNVLQVGLQDGGLEW